MQQRIEPLTDEQAIVLNQARAVLEELAGVAPEVDDDHESWCHGRLAEAADVAASAIYNVLNVANAYLDSKVAERWMHDQ